jgi:predicted ATPase
VTRDDLPTGTVTFLFTDIEGSTRLLHELGAEAYAGALAEHRRVLRDAFARHGGVEVDTQGDAFFVAFSDAPRAVRAANDVQDALTGPIRVRMGLHTGEPLLTEEGYVGTDLHRGARIGAAGHGGQVLLSKETRELVTAEVLDLGEHRVKDFAEPVWIFQIGTDRFPPLKTISNTNLPRPASSFLGREREIDEIGSLLQDRARLLTLSGPGGSGKTRLAIEAGSELVPEFRNGVFWVELASLRDPALVAGTMAQTVGAKDGLADSIGEREMLLLLDNFEQVIEAAPELSDLLEACPNLRFLVTSRERLRVRGEVDYPVPPLAEREAAELFCVRSRLEPDEDVVELCRRLDNLPLAVELAAARTSVLSPAQILERLSRRLDLLEGGRDADPRQQTLRTTIGWSHDLLAEEEKTLFARMSVFAGGCTLEAAEELAGADLDTLASLVDKSLLRHTEERFWMLETIREYALERLTGSGEAEEVGRRHAEHFLALAETAEPSVLGPNPAGSLDLLEREHDNLRLALDRLAASGEMELALRLAGALWEFWCLRGHVAEGWRRLEDLLDRDERPSFGRAKALTGATHLAQTGGMDAAAQQVRAEQALALYGELGDAWGVAFGEFQYALVFALEGDFAYARPILEQSVGRLRELGDEHRALQALDAVALGYLEVGEVVRAKALYEELLQGARGEHDDQMEARALSTLSRFATDEGRPQDALALLRDAYRLDRQIGDPWEIAIDLFRFARALAFAGREEAAAQLLSRGQTMREELGLTHPAWVHAIEDEAMTRTRSQLDEEAFAEAWGRGRTMTVDEAVAIAVGPLD